MVRGGAARAELLLRGSDSTGVVIHDDQMVRHARDGCQRRKMKGPGDGSTSHDRNPYAHAFLPIGGAVFPSRVGKKRAPAWCGVVATARFSCGVADWHRSCEAPGSPGLKESCRDELEAPREDALQRASRGVDRVLRRSRADVEQRSEEHTSELQSQSNLVCRLLLEHI